MRNFSSFLWDCMQNLAVVIIFAVVSALVFGRFLPFAAWNIIFIFAVIFAFIDLISSIVNKHVPPRKPNMVMSFFLVAACDLAIITITLRISGQIVLMPMCSFWLFTRWLKIRYLWEKYTAAVENKR